MLGAEFGAGTDAGRKPGRRREAAKRMLIVAGVCAVCIAPLAWHLLRLPRVNPAPITYMARELCDPSFALPIATPLVIVLAFVGLLKVWPRMRQPVGLLPAYALIGLAGQLLGYLRLLAGAAIPALIPHEFQWNFQIAVGLLAAAGAAHIAGWLTSFRGLGGRLRLSLIHI